MPNVVLGNGAHAGTLAVSGTQILLANNGDNGIFCNTIVQDLRIFANERNDLIFADRGTVTVNTGPELATGGDGILVNADSGIASDVPAIVKIVGKDCVSGLSVYSLGTLVIPTGVVLDVTGNLTLEGTIDMAGGSLLKRAAATGPTPAQLRVAFIAGRNAGAWNGTHASGAINSSLANSSSTSDGVGSQIGLTSIGGIPIASGDTLLRHVLDGDTNLDGAVDFGDLLTLAQNNGQVGRLWTQGDSAEPGTELRHQPQHIDKC